MTAAKLVLLIALLPFILVTDVSVVITGIMLLSMAQIAGFVFIMPDVAFTLEMASVDIIIGYDASRTEFLKKLGYDVDED